METVKAKIQHLPEIMEIIAEAQQFMRDSGVNQWQEGYPTAETFENDIKNGNCYVVLVDGKVGGVITIMTEPEECYAAIEDGQWLTGDVPYVVFHRSAVSKECRGMGIAKAMLEYAERFAIENGYNSVRADTHRDNKAMRGLFEKCGYVNCGTVWLDIKMTPDNHRYGYEKLLTK